MQLFESILDQFKQAFTTNELCFAVICLFKSSWTEGMETLLNHKTTKLIYISERSEQRHVFIQLLLEKKTELERTIVRALKSWPYVTYACLRYPASFLKYEIFDVAMQSIQDEDILHFVMGHPNNLEMLNLFNQQMQSKISNPALQRIVNKATEMHQTDHLMEPLDPEPLITMIKAGNTRAFVSQFESIKARILSISPNLFDSSNQL